MEMFINAMKTISSSYGINLKECAGLLGYSMESTAIMYAVSLVILGGALVHFAVTVYKRHVKNKDKSQM